MTLLSPVAVSAGRAPGSAGTAVFVEEGYCINLRGRIEACDLCCRACHAGAISIRPDAVKIDPDRCTDCGACVPACPSGAIGHGGFEPGDLLRADYEDGCCQIACTASTATAPARIPCHKMLDARLLAALFAEGAEKIEAIGTEYCGNCPSGDARPALATAVRTLTKWFGDAAPPVVTAGSNGGSDSRPGDGVRAVRRRALLRRALRPLTQPSPGAQSPTPPSPTPPIAPPSFDELAAFDTPDEAAPARPVPYQVALAERRHALPFRPGGPVGATGRTVGEACSGCLICAQLCPTGALEGDLSVGYRAITFDPALCTNCTLCLKICPMEGISARALRGVAAACSGRRHIYARAEQYCTECGAQFAPTEESRGRCPTCKNEMEMDEEWLEMLVD